METYTFGFGSDRKPALVPGFKVDTCGQVFKEEKVVGLGAEGSHHYWEVPLKIYRDKYPKTVVTNQIEAIFHAHPIREGHNPKFYLVYAGPERPSDRVLIRVRTMAGDDAGCEPGRIIFCHPGRAFKIAHGHSISSDGIRSVDMILDVHPMTFFIVVAGSDQLHRRFKIAYSGGCPPTFTEIKPHP
ncbi:MAG: hypothetical protein WC735_03330 [Candidatus Paceibacterota bacterium]|jgi:hypothetical protein